MKRAPFVLSVFGCLVSGSIFAPTLLAWGTPTQSSPAQVEATPPLIFDVATIRPMANDDNTPAHITNAYNGYFKAVNVNLKALLEVAYDIPDLRMYGGPKWIDTRKFYVEAKTSPELEQYIAKQSPEEGKQMEREMLATLLADRFKVLVHTESRELPIYAMVLAKGRPTFSEANPGAATRLKGGDQITVKPGNDSLTILAYELSWRLGRPVVNRTGLQYKNKLTLRWNDEDAAAGLDSLSVFSAIQEQLGLKLEATKGPVPVLLIDRAEAPTGN